MWLKITSSLTFGQVPVLVAALTITVIITVICGRRVIVPLVLALRVQARPVLVLPRLY